MTSHESVLFKQSLLVSSRRTCSTLMPMSLRLQVWTMMALEGLPLVLVQGLFRLRP